MIAGWPHDTSSLRVENSTYTYCVRAPARETVTGRVDRVKSDEHTFFCHRGPLACYSLRESGDYITLHYIIRKKIPTPE